MTPVEAESYIENPRSRAALWAIRFIERLETAIAAVRWGRAAADHYVQFSPPRWLYTRSADGSIRNGDRFVTVTRWKF